MSNLEVNAAERRSLAGLRGQVSALYHHRVVRDVRHTFAIRIAVIILGITVSIATARVLQPEGRGTYAAAIALTALFVQLGNFGIHTANAYDVARNPDRLGALIGNSIAIAVGVGGLAGLGLWCAGIWAPSLVGVRGTTLVVTSLSIPGMLLYLLLLNIAVGLERFSLLNAAEMLLAVTTACAVVTATVTHHLSPAFAVAAAGGANLGAALWLLRILRRDAKPRFARETLRASMTYAVRPYVVCVTGFLVTRFDLLFLNSSHGNEAAGLYSVALTVAGLMSTLPVIIGQVLFPRLTRMTDLDARWTLTTRAAVFTFGIVSLAAIVVGVIAPAFLGTVFGPSFREAAPSLVWLLPGVVLLAVEVVVVQYLNSIGYPFALVALWVGIASLNVGLNAVLIPAFGSRGAGMASSTTYLVLCMAVIAMAMRRARHNRGKSSVSSAQPTLDPTAQTMDIA